MKKILLGVIVIFVFLAQVVPAQAIEETIDKQQEKIAELEKKVSDLRSQANTLTNQIASYDSQIQLATLKISLTESQINTLTSKIDSLESKLQDRSRLLESQIVHTYKEGGTDSLQVIFSATDVSDMISRFKYLQIVQNNNRKFLHDTQLVQSSYAEQKDLISASKKKLQSQKDSLTVLRKERDALLKQTQSSEANYQKLLAQARAELASFASFTQGYGLLPPQPQPDGYYFNQRDNRWGGNCIAGTCSNGPEYIWQVGCLITDVAMVLKKNGQDVTPATIASDFSYFLSGTAYMLHSGLAAHGFTVNGGFNQSLVDSELSAGRPVIVHLTVNSKDGHYVLLKSGSGGNYVMNDPLTAANLNFKDSYSLSSINQVITHK